MLKKKEKAKRQNRAHFTELVIKVYQEAYMEKFLPLYSWDFNHMIKIYAYSLHGHVTTIQMQSIDFTPKTKN